MFGQVFKESNMSKGRSQSANNARSNSMNPNNAAGRAAANNHANQGNPNNAAHPSNAGGSATTPGAPSKDGK